MLWRYSFKNEDTSSDSQLNWLDYWTITTFSRIKDIGYCRELWSRNAVHSWGTGISWFFLGLSCFDNGYTPRCVTLGHIMCQRKTEYLITHHFRCLWRCKCKLWYMEMFNREKQWSTVNYFLKLPPCVRKHVLIGLLDSSSTYRTFLFARPAVNSRWRLAHIFLTVFNR